MKKITSLVLAVFLALTALSFSAFAEETQEISAEDTAVTTEENPADAEITADEAITAEDAEDAAEPRTEKTDSEEAEKAVSQKAEPAPTGTVDTPQVTKIEAVKTGAKITWGAVSGAAKYRVFVKSGTKWTKLGDTAATNFTDTKATVGTERTYTVRAMDASNAYVSDFNADGWTNTVLASPAVSSAAAAYANNTQNIKITWGKVSGAAVYRVFYKKGSATKWVKAGDSTTTSFLFKSSLTSGSKYTFTVRCLSADKSVYTSWYNESGKSMTFVSMPTNVKITNTTTGQKLTWTRQTGASKYRIFIKNGSSWKKLLDTNNAYTYTSVTSGTTYTYAIRSLDANGNYVSTYKTDGYSALFLAAPKITKMESTESGLHLVWGAVKGASKYRVYYNDGSKWYAAGDTTGTQAYYEAENGGTYTLTVQAMNASGTVVSAYDTTGKSLVYYDTPYINYINNVSTGVQIYFNTVEGVSKYRVFYKTGSSGWTKAGDTTADNFIFKGAKEGTTYTITVRGMNASGTYITGFDAEGFSITYRKNAKFTLDEDRVISELVAYGESLGFSRYQEFDADEDPCFTVDYTGWYGSNAGDVTDFFIEAGKTRMKNYYNWLVKNGYTAKGFKFDVLFYTLSDGEKVCLTMVEY